MKLPDNAATPIAIIARIATTNNQLGAPPCSLVSQLNWVLIVATSALRLVACALYRSLHQTRPSRYHATVPSIPSRRPMDAVHPAAVSLETSMSLRGVPSGLVVSHSTAPV